MANIKHLLREIFVAVEAMDVAALEALATTNEALDGKAGVEREKVFYGLISDFSQLDKADSWEDQEQWEIRPTETGTGVVRVRKTSNGEISLATKVFNGDSRTETEIEIPEDIFEGFRTIAPGGMIKRRYVFNIPDTQYKWEVDVYRDGENGWHNWCKIDLECEDLDMQTPEFPITLEKVISGDRSKLSSEDRSVLDYLFKAIFVTPNPKRKSFAEAFHQTLKSTIAKE